MIILFTFGAILVCVYMFTQLKDINDFGLLLGSVSVVSLLIPRGLPPIGVLFLGIGLFELVRYMFRKKKEKG